MLKNKFILFATLILFGASAWAESVVVKKIEIKGLQKISRGTVFNYLPVDIGEKLDPKLSEDIVRALFKTGFFNDIKILVDGNTLVIEVEERPTIAKISFEGNKDIDKDQLTTALKDIGLAVGRVFNRSLLAKVEQELRQLYFSRGKYGIKVKSTVESLDANRVNVQIDIIEGRVAKIKSINLVGNKRFKTKELLGKFKLSTPTMFSFISGNDQYSEQKLRGDLETLKSYYLDRGFINFSIESTQVTITPDKKHIYMTVNVSEGDQFTVADIKLAGQMVVDKKKLQPLISVKKGDIFSRKVAVESSERIRDLLGNDGYAFSNVNLVPDIDQTKKEVKLTFFVDPGKRVYVRRINIAGNQKTKDDVIRRELRQLEGAWLSTVRLNRSRTRLMLLGFFDEVNIETPRVAGTNDQVDINMKVTERSSGNMIASIGYQQGTGPIFNIAFNWDNFLGTGKRVAATLNNSTVTKVYNFSYSNPYYTMNGVSRAFNVFSRETDTSELDISSYVTDVNGAGVTFGYPFSEFDRFRLGLSVERSHFILDEQRTDDGTILTYRSPPPSFTQFRTDFGDVFNMAKMEMSWSHNARNRAIFPDRGSLQTLTLEGTFPGSELEFYKARYRHVRYLPLTKFFTLVGDLEVATGKGYGVTGKLPFFENYFAGGERSVRGYRSNTLGPREPILSCVDNNVPYTPNDTSDDNCTEIDKLPVGGSFRTLVGLEIQFPPPFSPDNKSVRFSLFVDGGNVFEDYDSFDSAELRYSAGLSATWLTPIGPLTFSWADAFNHDPAVDETQSFQFTIGVPL